MCGVGGFEETVSLFRLENGGTFQKLMLCRILHRILWQTGKPWVYKSIECSPAPPWSETLQGVPAAVQQRIFLKERGGLHLIDRLSFFILTAHTMWACSGWSWGAHSLSMVTKDLLQTSVTLSAASVPSESLFYDCPLIKSSCSTENMFSMCVSSVLFCLALFMFTKEQTRRC